jgi:hypothetical protein
MKKKSLFAIVGGGLSLAMAAVAIGGFVNSKPQQANATIAWTKLTGALPTSGGHYLIVGSGYYMVAKNAVTATGGYAAADFSNISTISENNTFTFTTSTNGYTIQDGSNYLYSTNTNNGLGSQTATYEWTVAETATAGEYTIITVPTFTISKVTGKTRQITQYGNSNFRVYDSSTDNAKTVNLYYATAVADVAATSISLGAYSSTMTAGTSQQITATMLPATTTESVVWSISDSSIAEISDGGTAQGVSTATILPLSNGTATITATAYKTTSVTISTSTITVSGFSSSTAPLTLTSSNLELSTSYAASSGDKMVENAIICVENAMNASKDYTPTSSSVVIGSTVYEAGAIQMQKATSFIYTKTKFAAKISKVLMSGVATGSVIAVQGGATAKDVASTATQTVNGLIYTYAFATPVDYVTISAGSTATGYANSFTLEFVGGAETTASLAAYISGLIPDRADNTALCVGTTGNYVVAKTRYLAATAAVRSDFQVSTDAAVVTARNRYVQWCAVAGDEDPYGSTIVAQSSGIAETLNDNYGLIGLAIVGVFGILAMAGVVVLKKKHN